MTQKENTVGIIGGGLIGSSWAMMFSAAGFNVVVYEEEKVARDSLYLRIREKLSLSLSHQLIHVKRERVNLETESSQQDQSFQISIDEQIEKCLNRIKLTDSLEEVVLKCFFVQESIPERLELKQKLFKRVDQILEEEEKSKHYSSNEPITIFGSSSSALSISSILSLDSSPPNSKSLSLSSLIVHPVNPPDIIPLVELIPSEKTLPYVIKKVQTLLSLANKRAILVKKEVDGFVVNRLQYALLSEAYRLVKDGVASPQDVDAAIADGLGMRWAFMGPFKTIHLNAPNGVSDYCERYISTVERITRTQDNSVHWEKPVIDQIHETMESEIPLEKRREAYQWRDQKLLEIAKIKMNN